MDNVMFYLRMNTANWDDWVKGEAGYAWQPAYDRYVLASGPCACARINKIAGEHITRLDEMLDRDPSEGRSEQAFNSLWAWRASTWLITERWLWKGAFSLPVYSHRQR